MTDFSQYTVEIDAPKNKNELWGAWCKELKLSAFGETESEAFYNLVENIPEYFSIKGEAERTAILRKKTTKTKSRTFTLPAFA